MTAPATMAVLADPGAAPVGRRAVLALRHARRANRVASLEWFELAYRVYLTAIASVVGVLLLAGAIGDGRLDAAGRADAARIGPAVVGLLAAIALAIGLRSGSRGGPLALEPAEVRHVLLAPVERRNALVDLALAQLRHAAFTGGAVGAVSGVLAARRFGASRVPWSAWSGLAGAVVGVATIGVALLAGGLRLSRAVATAVAGLLIAGALADLTGVIGWWPTSLAGQLALWPLRRAPVALVVVALALALAVAGVVRLGGVELEAAERRTSLAGQLRFAVTTRDLRTVVVLHRQLAQDLPRPRPWFAVPGAWPVWRRAWRGLTRTPLGRLARMVVLASGTGLCVAGVQRGTTPLVAVGALTGFVLGLDGAEPLAQDVDQAERSSAAPVGRDSVHARLLLPIALALVPFALVASAVAAAAAGGSRAAAALGAAACVVSGLAGAVVSLVMGAPALPGGAGLAGPERDMLPPEVASAGLVLRSSWPVIVAAAGYVSVLGGRAVAARGSDELTGALPYLAITIAVVVLTAGWVGFRDALIEWRRTLVDPAKQAGRS